MHGSANAADVTRLRAQEMAPGDAGGRFFPESLDSLPAPVAGYSPSARVTGIWAVAQPLARRGDVARHGAAARDRRRITPWIVHPHEYGKRAGMIISLAADVEWELPEGPFVYWQGRITAADYRFLCQDTAVCLARSG